MTPRRPKKGPRDGGIQISPLVQAAAKVKRNKGRWQTTYAAAAQLFRPAEHPSGARPPSGMAMDDNAFFGQNALWGARSVEASMLLEGQAFLGYPTLAIMAQRTENRAIVNILSTEMTRKWVRLVSKGRDRAKANKIAAITDRLKDLKVQRAFKQAAEGDGYFGRGHLFLQFQAGDWDDKEEIKTSIGDGRDDVSRAKCSRANPLVAIKYVEAVWTYPVDYNTTDPLRDDWFKPSTWMVMATTIHATRLLRFVMNEVPDLLKPAYSFGGLSMTQMARPYVDNWLKIRQSVSDLVRQFTIRVLSTNLKTTLSGGSDASLYDRAELLTDMESNNGVVMLDQDTESINQVSAPIGGLHELQAQAEEHMSLPGRIPTVKLSGISPTGLNASSDGELEAFDDTISSMQAALFADPLRTILGFVQLSLYDEVDDDIDFEFIPLVEERPLEKAQRRLIEAQYHGAYVEMGAVDGGAVRRALAEDPDSPYPGLEEEPEAGSEDPWANLASSFAEESSDDPWTKLASSFSPRSTDDGWKKLLASDDSEFEEKHPRGEGGEFGTGSSHTGIRRGGTSRSAASALERIKYDPEVTADPHERIASLVRDIPSHIIAESDIRHVEVADNPEDAEAAIQALFDREDINEDARGARGVYDRRSGTLISSLWISEDAAESGRNFYHEFAHSLGDRITSDDWEHAFHEWAEYGQDEGFAEAFSDYMVRKRTGDLPTFEEAHPDTATMFKKWGL